MERRVDRDSARTVPQRHRQVRACPRLVAWREQVAVEKRRRSPTRSTRDADAGLRRSRRRHPRRRSRPGGARRRSRRPVFTGDRSGDWLFRAMHRGRARQPVDDGSRRRRADAPRRLRRGGGALRPTGQPPTPDGATPARRSSPASSTLLAPRSSCASAPFAFDVVPPLRRPPRPKFGHGVEIARRLRATVLCSFHPSQQNTFTGRLTKAMLDTILAVPPRCRRPLTVASIRSVASGRYLWRRSPSTARGLLAGARRCGVSASSACSSAHGGGRYPPPPRRRPRARASTPLATTAGVREGHHLRRACGDVFGVYWRPTRPTAPAHDPPEHR